YQTGRPRHPVGRAERPGRAAGPRRAGGSRLPPAQARRVEAKTGGRIMTTETKSAEVTIPTGTDEMRKFLKRAHSGDESTLPVLRKMLENPTTMEVLGGNLAQQAELSFIGAAAGKNLAFKEALVRKLALMRAELAGPDPTPLERLLVGRVVACWLQVQDADIRYAQGQKDCLI